MQGFILKSTASHNSRLKLAGRIDRQAGSNGIPDRNRNAFNGKRVSNRQFHGSTAATLNDGNRFEDAFWKKRPLQGRQITSADVLSAYVNDRTSLGSGFFLQKLCLKNMLHDNRKVTPDQVIQEFNRKPDRSNKYKLAIARFKVECCLRRLPLNGLQVTPDAVVKDFERGGWLLERAIFYSQLALNAMVLHGSYLDNQKVLAAFNKVPGDHSSRQAEYLMQRLKQPQWYDETNEARDIIQKAWQILNNVSVKDEQHRLQCILKFMAMQNELTIDHQSVSAEQVLQSINMLRRSFQNSRIHFFFLAYCYMMRQPVDGRQIHKDQVIECLQSFPEGSKLRHALGYWFEQGNSDANIMDNMLFKRENAVPRWGIHPYEASASQYKASVANPGREGPFPYQVREFRDEPENTSTTAAVNVSAPQTLKQWSSGPDFPDNPIPRLNALTLKTLNIIQEINGSYADPLILITGSYSRFLQNLCSLFNNDIDIICTTEESARTLFAKLQALNINGRDSGIPKSITIWPIRGCQAIKLPNA